MRIWSVHPKYLDRQGLVALWRETLLAQAVLSGKTKGYRYHPQLRRFQDQPSPLAAIAQYLRGVQAEAARRGYRFDATKIDSSPPLRGQMTVTQGQLQYEWNHLLKKLRSRNPEWHSAFAAMTDPEPHPLFSVVHGPVEPWEKL